MQWPSSKRHNLSQNRTALWLGDRLKGTFTSSFSFFLLEQFSVVVVVSLAYQRVTCSHCWLNVVHTAPTTLPHCHNEGDVYQRCTFVCPFVRWPQSNTLFVLPPCPRLDLSRLFIFQSFCCCWPDDSTKKVQCETSFLACPFIAHVSLQTAPSLVHCHKR